MRQTRDGAIELVDRSPAEPDGAFSAVIASFGWSRALVWYMRTLAWVWLAKGLFNWAIILGVFPGAKDFATMTLALQAAIIAFACLDLLAAVGLWLAAAWGGAIWLLCAVVEAALPFMIPHAALISYFAALLNVVLILGYFALSWRAMRGRD
jgi:hypothetical protein